MDTLDSLFLKKRKWGKQGLSANTIGLKLKQNKKQVTLEKKNNGLQLKYITAGNRKYVFSTRSKVCCKHNDVEGKSHEDHGGLYGNENQTSQSKTSVEQVKSKLDTVSDQTGELEE